MNFILVQRGVAIDFSKVSKFEFYIDRNTDKYCLFIDLFIYNEDYGSLQREFVEFKDLNEFNFSKNQIAQKLGLDRDKL